MSDSSCTPSSLQMCIDENIIYINEEIKLWNEEVKTFNCDTHTNTFKTRDLLNTILGRRFAKLKLLISLWSDQAQQIILNKLYTKEWIHEHVNKLEQQS